MESLENHRRMIENIDISYRKQDFFFLSEELCKNATLRSP